MFGAAATFFAGGVGGMKLEEAKYTSIASEDSKRFGTDTAAFRAYAKLGSQIVQAAQDEARFNANMLLLEHGLKLKEVGNDCGYEVVSLANQSALWAKDTDGEEVIVHFCPGQLENGGFIGQNPFQVSANRKLDNSTLPVELRRIQKEMQSFDSNLKSFQVKLATRFSPALVEQGMKVKM